MKTGKTFCSIKFKHYVLSELLLGSIYSNHSHNKWKVFMFYDYMQTEMVSKDSCKYLSINQNHSLLKKKTKQRKNREVDF